MAVNWVSNGNEDLERTAVPQGNDDSSSRSSSSGVIIASSSRSETSHSSDLSSTPLTDLPRSNQIKDRNSLLQNLSNYQAIGCLRLRTHEFVTQQQEILSGWQEVTEGRQLVPDDVVLRAGLIKLLDASWIRLTCKINPRCHDSLAVRVYVLPDDVGRTFIARSCNVLRKHLRRILESIDKSPSTWDSEFDPQSPVLGICPEAPDVGSLFYLFNTLPSPSPCPERIRDRLLRSTVEDLLCFEKPLDGLKTNLLPYQRRSAAMMVEKEICPRLTLDPRLQEVSAPDQSVFYFDQDGSSIFRHRREYEGPRGGILAETMGLG
ncbi:MAG: hypothetical protein M1837_005892 [Sclerophora amabilis]|nr:MAG: hypothetical protein M1837_005892 [Sclerophora amabilis]